MHTEEEDEEEKNVLTKSEEKLFLNGAIPGGTCASKQKESAKSMRSYQWRDLATVSILCFTFLFINSGYSILGPFFPNEVRFVHAQLNVC